MGGCINIIQNVCIIFIHFHILTYVDRLEEGVQGGEGHQQVGVEVDPFADGRQREHEGGGALWCLGCGVVGVWEGQPFLGDLLCA